MKYKISLLAIMVLFTFNLSVAQKRQMKNRKTVAAAFARLEPDYTNVQSELQQLDEQRKQLLNMMASFNEAQKKVAEHVKDIEGKLNDLGPGSDNITSAAGGNSQDQLMAATKQMQETQMSFNLQYLQLQSSMQNTNRQFTTVSAVIRTKHDKVKNILSNAR